MRNHDQMTAQPRLDPRISLASAVDAQPGVYALLIGSGVSTGVGIPTGWGVVEALVRKVAAASGAGALDDIDPETWWKETFPALPLGYSTLLEQLAPTAAARRELLSTFFEPSEQDRQDGRRVPGPAHKAIAKLVARGSIRVIITTNFDRLLEQALEAENVLPQVVSTEAATHGMEPFQHATVTVIKLHGDYASLEQRNTVDELSAYPEATTSLLARVFDEYGLIVCGWSGEYDPALVDALSRSANRRYPLFWSSYEQPNSIARQFTARGGAASIPGMTADGFFTDLLARTEALEMLSETPQTTQVRLQRMKRVLADPIRHLEVRDLFADELARVEEWNASRAENRSGNNVEAFDAELDAIAARIAPLSTLFSQGMYLDRDRQHSQLWQWVVERAMRIRSAPATGSPGWEALDHYPAYLLLRAGVLGALAAGHEAEIPPLLINPRWGSTHLHGGAKLPAHNVLHEWIVLSDEVVRKLPRFAGKSTVFPVSRLTRAHLEHVALDLAGRAGAGSLLDHMEFRMALAHRLLIPEGLDAFLFYQPVAGIFAWRPNMSRIDPPVLQVTTEFLRTSKEPWQEFVGDTLAERVKELDEELRKQTRYV